MLDGGAHHSSVREIEPLIWPLSNCQTHCILNGQAQIVNKKIIGLGWPYEGGPSGPRIRAAQNRVRGLEGFRLLPLSRCLTLLSLLCR